MIENFEITSAVDYAEGVRVEIMNNARAYRWRLVVNGEISRSSGTYQGVMQFKDWFLATDYWNGVFPDFVPFKITEATRV